MMIRKIFAAIKEKQWPATVISSRACDETLKTIPEDKQQLFINVLTELLQQVREKSGGLEIGIDSITRSSDGVLQIAISVTNSVSIVAYRWNLQLPELSPGSIARYTTEITLLGKLMENIPLLRHSIVFKADCKATLEAISPIEQLNFIHAFTVTIQCSNQTVTYFLSCQ